MPLRLSADRHLPNAQVRPAQWFPQALWQGVQFLLLLALSTIGAALLQSWIPTSDFYPPLKALFPPRCTILSVSTPIDAPFTHIRASPDSFAFNFALKQCGASILPEFTGAPVRSFVSSADNARDMESGDLSTDTLFDLFGTSPEHAIDGDLQLPQCWEFHGPSGQLGIGLTGMLNISWISIDYDAEEGFMPAPRTMILWGIADSVAAASYFEKQGKLLEDLRRYLPEGVQQPLPANYPYVPLAVMEYNPHLAARQQSFSVFREVAMLGFPIGALVLQIVGNWGAPSTRLCQIGIYGKPVVPT